MPSSIILCYCLVSEVGTNNIIPKAQRNKAQRFFQPVKAQSKKRNFIFLSSEAQRNFCNDFSIQLKRHAIPQLRNSVFVAS